MPTSAFTMTARGFSGLGCGFCSWIAVLADDVADCFLAHAERFGCFLAGDRLALVDAFFAVREDEVSFRRHSGLRRQALREESGLAQCPHFGDAEAGFARFVVDAFQFGEFTVRVFVFQFVPFLSLSMSAWFSRMNLSMSIPCCVRVGLPVSTRAFPSLVTFGLLCIRVTGTNMPFFISPPSFDTCAPMPTFPRLDVGI